VEVESATAGWGGRGERAGRDDAADATHTRGLTPPRDGDGANAAHGHVALRCQTNVVANLRVGKRPTTDFNPTDSNGFQRAWQADSQTEQYTNQPPLVCRR
jgi:hypothetical protein